MDHSLQLFIYSFIDKHRPHLVGKYFPFNRTTISRRWHKKLALYVINWMPHIFCSVVNASAVGTRQWMLLEWCGTHMKHQGCLFFPQSVERLAFRARGDRSFAMRQTFYQVNIVKRCFLYSFETHRPWYSIERILQTFGLFTWLNRGVPVQVVTLNRRGFNNRNIKDTYRFSSQVIHWLQSEKRVTVPRL